MKVHAHAPTAVLTGHPMQADVELKQEGQVLDPVVNGPLDGPQASEQLRGGDCDLIAVEVPSLFQHSDEPGGR